MNIFADDYHFICKPFFRCKDTLPWKANTRFPSRAATSQLSRNDDSRQRVSRGSHTFEHILSITSGNNSVKNQIANSAKFKCPIVKKLCKKYTYVASSMAGSNSTQQPLQTDKCLR